MYVTVERIGRRRWTGVIAEKALRGVRFGCGTREGVWRTVVANE